MKALLSVLVMLASGLLPVAAADNQSLAERSALAWLEQLDAGQYVTTWNDAAAIFRDALTPQQWETAASSARKPLGALQSRKLISATPVTDLPGAPTGQYVVLQFETAFANKGTAFETVTPFLENGVWRVSGYYVR